jgi:hypothetical protein
MILAVSYLPFLLPKTDLKISPAALSCDTTQLHKGQCHGVRLTQNIDKKLPDPLCFKSHSTDSIQCSKAVELVHKTSDSNSSIFKFPTPTPS